ncbi:hypothetical protein HPB52_000291 [Rhipicephalus sanguineus]|uniref:Uncharacterized protein n=1 Tax=Rhipicephalus sanguineus TaxID=34632 RepID=A0A9D4PYA3_RHISA|nr:hypothetical protein HPB52_000291 [Rhipicephalus sanguineus]
MNLSTILIITLLAANCHCTLLGPLLSLTLLPYTIIYHMAGIAGVKVALALKLLGLLGWWRAGISDATLDRELDFRRVELPTGAVFPGTPNLPVHMIPGILAEIVRSVLQDDNVGSGFFQREPAAEQQASSPWARSRGTPASPLGLLLGGGQWPVDPQPAQPGVHTVFEHPAWTDGTGYDRYKRDATSSFATRLPPGFFRRPRLGEPGKAPTARDLYGYTLEMIQDIDADGCMLKLCCEVGAEPVRYGSYGRRLSGFIRQLRRLSGEASLLRRYHEAFEKGHLNFRGNSSMCAPIFRKCNFDMQTMTDLVF